MLPGLVLDTTEPDHLSVRETGEMADPRTASATIKFRDKNSNSACCSPAQGRRENRVESRGWPDQPRRGFVSVNAGWRPRAWPFC